MIIIEDIVDTGHTMSEFLPLSWQRWSLPPRGIASLLVKTEALECDIDIQYTGFEIPMKFVIGYGTGLRQAGTQYSDIYQLAD